MPELRTVKDDNHYFQIKRQRFGERYVSYRAYWKEAGTREYVHPHPLYIHIDIVDSCNLHCPHCFETVRRDRDKIRNKGTLNVDLLLNRLKECGSGNIYSLNIGNVSEPLLTKDKTLKVIEGAAALKIMDIFLHTNATLLDDEISRNLIDAGLSDIFFSMDASDKETYQVVRGADFDETVQKIRNFVSLRNKNGLELPRTRVSLFYQPENIDKIGHFEKFWSQLIDKVEFQPLHNMNGHTNVGDKLEQTDFQCDMPWKMLSLWPNGDVGPCCTGFSNRPDILLGNLKEKSLQEMWNGEKMRALRKGHLSGDLRNFPTCQECLKWLFVPKLAAEDKKTES